MARKNPITDVKIIQATGDGQVFTWATISRYAQGDKKYRISQASARRLSAAISTRYISRWPTNNGWTASLYIPRQTQL